ncbi:unnamed protein product [Mucor hiemalis]
MGQAVLRLLQFRDQLSPGDQAQEISFWNSFVEDFFTPNAIFKVTLWDNLQGKHTEFDIIQSLIARFFFTHYECDLESIQLTTDQTMEYFLPTGMMLECPRSSLIYRYKNGTLVILSGELSVLFNMDQNDGVLKIHQWKFKCNHHDEYIARSKLVSADTNAALKKKPKGTPKPPSFHAPEVLVNSWGLPNRITELLNITDASNRFSEVVFFSQLTGLPPQESLAAMSFALSQQMPFSYPTKEDERHPQEQQQQQHIKDELDELMSSPLLTTDFLSLSSFPETNSSVFMQQQQQNNNASSSAAPTPTPIHNSIPSNNNNNNNNHINMTPQHQHNIMMNSPRQQHNNHSNTPHQHHMSQSHSTPQQSHTMVDTSQHQNGYTMGTPRQQTHPNTPQQVNNMNMMSMPMQQNNNNLMSSPHQQQQQNMTMANTPQRTMINTPQQQHNPLLNSTMGQPINNNAPANIQLMHNQATMQRYYQQQQRIQQQQQALQMQQRQALQRLQSPYTTTPPQQPSEPTSNSSVNMQSSTPTPSLTIENVTPEAVKTATPRKRKMSTQKDGPKKVPGKKNKKQQQQQQQQ